MHFEPVDRPFHWETLGMWPETLDRWFAKGLDPTLNCPRADDWGAVDSDGDVTTLVPLFLSAGANAMLPFEVQVGMDVRTFRKRYGKALAIIGGLDKRVLAQGRAAIDRELCDRMLTMLRSGGYIPCLDHTVPLDVNLRDFQYFVQRAREFAEPC
jgi:hypothetical protein